MTDLTDKWKKGELPEGFYYFKLPNGEIDTGKDFGLAILLMCEDGDKIEVLSEVPSYDELQNIKKSVNDLMASNIKLVEENKQLKELLKECRDVAEFTKTIVNKHKWLDGVIAKINQALGEE